MKQTIHLIEYACDYCGKKQDEVGYLVVGPKDAAICDACVEVCRQEIEAAKARKVCNE